MIRAALIIGLLCSAVGARAQTTEELTAEKARLEAQKGVIEERKAVIDARIAALGLPSFEGSTKLEGEGGKIEAAMLTAQALDATAVEIGRLVQLPAQPAAQKPALLPPSPKIVTVADDEVVNFALLESLKREIKYLDHRFDLVLPQKAHAADVAVIPGIIGAAAGLFRSETTITGIDLKKSMPSRLLASRVAQLTGTVSPAAIVKTPATSTLLSSLGTLAAKADQAREIRAAIGEKPQGANAAKAIRLEAVLKDYDAFAGIVTALGSDGVSPLISALRLEKINAAEQVLRVRVEEAGGSFVNSKNLATTLGLDPVKVSGGIIASFELTDMSEGTVLKSGIVICRTTLTSLRRVQENRLRGVAFGCETLKMN